MNVDGYSRTTFVMESDTKIRDKVGQGFRDVFHAFEYFLVGGGNLRAKTIKRGVLCVADASV